MEGIKVEFETYLNDGLYGLVLVESTVYPASSSKSKPEVKDIKITSVYGDNVTDKLMPRYESFINHTSIRHAAEEHD